MKYILMCGGTYRQWEKPRHLTEINGEILISRTIRQLKEHGITDISISSNNPIFEQFGVPVLHHTNRYDAKGYNDFTGYWCEAFYPTEEPTCYIFGDVIFTDAAIKIITETETDDIQFFASAPPFSPEFKKDSAEPFALKVVNTDHLKEAIKTVKALDAKGMFRRKPIMWELWQVIKDTLINIIDYTNYVVINDSTCDIDDPEELTENKIRLKCYTNPKYDHFPENHAESGKPFLNCYVGDYCAREPIKPNSIALLLEPRSIERAGYNFVERYPEFFKYIFTYDSKLLKFPNAKFWLWAGVWAWADVPKTKNVSLIASHKAICELHQVRRDLVKIFEGSDKVDCFGTYTGNMEDYADTYTTHAEYRFAIAIENYIDDYWFTEKILNCFSTKTVPIYYGARKINEFFNPDGIIQVDDWHIIPELVESLNIEEEYNRRKPAIEDNYNRVRAYDGRWRERFIKQFEDILRPLMEA